MSGRREPETHETLKCVSGVKFKRYVM
jgi:hypothetical protein